MAQRHADRAVAVRADHQLVTGVQLQRAQYRRHTLGHVAHPRRAGRLDAQKPGRALSRRRDQQRELDPVEAVRIALGAVPPGRSHPAHRDRRDTERAMVEVKDPGVKAKGLQQCSIHPGDSASGAATTGPAGPARSARRLADPGTRWSHSALQVVIAHGEGLVDPAGGTDLPAKVDLPERPEMGVSPDPLHFPSVE